MANKSKKLKLNIKGKFKMFWNQYFLKRNIQKLGVSLQDVKDHASDHVEIVVSGEKDNLWNVVKWTKNQNLFFVLNEVLFEFTD